MQELLFTHRIIDTVDGWETALYETAHTAYKERALGAIYLKDIVDQVAIEKTRTIINYDTVIWHAPPDEHVRRDTIAYLGVNQPFTYFNTPIRHAFVFAAQTRSQYHALMRRVIRFTMEASLNPRLYQKTNMKAWFQANHTPSDTTQ